MSGEPRNKSLYKYVKRLADKKFLSKTGVYKSSWIVREYKKRGGKYSGTKKSSSGLKRWYKEKWIDLNRPMRNSKGKIIGYKSCGRSTSKQRYPLCRPSKKITSKTPRVYKSLSKSAILKAKKQKSKLKHRGRIYFGGDLDELSVQSLKKFTCNYCDFTSRTKLGIDNHIKKYHKTNYKAQQVGGNANTENEINAIKSFKLMKEHSKQCKGSKCDIVDKVECEFCDNNNCEKSNDEKTCQEKEKFNEQFGSGEIRSQYYGRKSSVMVSVPETVKRTALYSFKLKKLGFKGGLETGWKRAKQLATKSEIPVQDVKYMRAWFARHVYTSYPTYKAWIKAGRPKDSKWYNKHGIIAWLIWSGDAAFKWVNSKKIINLLNKHYPGKDYKPIKH